MKEEGLGIRGENGRCLLKIKVEVTDLGGKGEGEKTC